MKIINSNQPFKSLNYLNSTKLVYKIKSPAFFVLLLTALLLFTTTQTFAFSVGEFENKQKLPILHSFTFPPEIQKEKDYFDRYIKNSYPTQVAITNGDDGYNISSEDNYKVLSYKDEFKLKYKVGPVFNFEPKISKFFCFQDMPYRKLDSAYYELPLFDNLNSDIPTFSTTTKRGIHGNMILLNFTPVVPESNYKFFKYTNGRIEPTPTSIITSTVFNICFESMNGQYGTNSKEAVDLIYTYKDEGAGEHLTQVMRRSYFGNIQKAELDLLKENQRTDNIFKTNTQPAQLESPPSKILKILLPFLPYISIFALLLTLVYRIIKKKNESKLK